MLHNFDSVSEVVLPHVSLSGFRKLINGKESDHLIALRHQLYTQVWSAIRGEIDECLAHVHEKGLQQVTDRIIQTAEAMESISSTISGAQAFNEIPTLSLFAGINLQDHDILYTQIAQRLRTQHQCFVMVLPSGQCTNPKTTMTMIVSELIGKVRDRILLDHDDVTGIGEVEFQNLVRSAKSQGFNVPPSYDIKTLVDWFRHLKSRNPTDGAPLIVLVFKDFEGFDQSTLETLIRIFSEYCGELPVSFVFGIATSVDCVQQALPKHVSSLLQIESINLQLSAESVNRIIDRILIPGHYGLSLGYEAYEHLLDQFFLHNFSVKALVSTLQYAFMDYFYANPLSVLVSFVASPDRAPLATGELSYTLDSLARDMAEDHFDILRMQPSVREYLEGLDLPAKALFAVLDDNMLFFNDHLRPLMDRLRHFRLHYTLAIRCFQSMQECCDQSSLKKPLRIIHLFNLNEDLFRTEHYKAVTKAFKRLNVETVTDFIRSCVEAFLPHVNDQGEGNRVWVIIRMLQDVIRGLCNEPNPTVTPDTVRMILQTDRTIHQADLEQLLTGVTATQQGGDSSDQSSVQTAVPSGLSAPPMTPHRNSSMRNDLYMSLLTGANRTPSAATPQRINRRLMVLPDQSQNLTDAQIGWIQVAYECLDQFFRRTLRCYDRVTLHELFYYDNKRLLKKAFNAQPRASVQTALGQPGLYIRCQCCATHKEVDAIHHSHDDTCVLYKLYLECGRLINLYDWFVAFSSIKEGDPRHPSPKELQARFVRGISELQFLGFIKPTTRKTDHVIRLTWGAM
ncbi:origin recognition complex subunit 3 N-terminus-domain-containing protein [Dimargaris cristalligena]|uniref:Origin recognition complex subunit 3 N-terminus-domain-containing protein n=1 Tax=Dimargaris cristalligena TaxID=215637 RepID=A0A4P9ZMN7_9FUNG|nr:origin recognition complex subunit 3 N-terminus-domain-containing protein [Dimargaris cristalligena]|eukprot:RKP34654.1 origin recognition complex subunit 3 N-terminus-domain-containing protein [Dimargaris cristalligena]